MALVDQIFEQARLGTAPNPDANPFALGLQLGQHQQSLEMQKQQLAVELAQAPLKQTLLQQDTQLNSAKLEQVLSSRQAEVDTEAQLAGLASRVQHAFTEASPTDAIPFLFEALQKTPRLAENVHFHQLVKDTQTSIQAATLAKHYDELTAERQAAITERRFKDMPNAAKFEELAKQAEAAGDTDTADMYREHATLEIQKETRLQQQQQDVHQHNQIRLEQLKANIARTANKAALDAFNSRLRNIENAPRMKLPERNAKVSELLAEYETKYGTGTVPPATPPAATSGAPRFTPGQVYRDKFGNQREYQADGTWKVLPQALP